MYGKLIAKNSFRKLWYDPQTFYPTSILFTEGESYDVINENRDRIIVNHVIFSKELDVDYVYNYFYTKKELRKQKLNKIKNGININENL